MHISGKAFVSHKEAFVAVAVFLVTALFFISLSVFATTIGTNIDATGTVGAATSTPWGVLAVEQTAGKSSLLPVFVVGDTGTNTPAIFVSQKGVVSFGSSTPSALFLNVGDVVIGRHGATNDLYVSGGLGVGNATTTDNGFVVGAGLLTVYANNNIGINGTTSPALTDGISIGTATAGTNADVYISGGLGVGDATTTDNAFSAGGVNAGLNVYGNGDVIIGATSSLYGFVVEKPGKKIFSTGSTATSTLSILNEAAADGANGCIEMSSDGLVYRIMIDGAGTALLVELGLCS